MKRMLNGDIQMKSSKELEDYEAKVFFNLF